MEIVAAGGVHQDATGHGVVSQGWGMRIEGK